MPNARRDRPSRWRHAGVYWLLCLLTLMPGCGGCGGGGSQASKSANQGKQGEDEDKKKKDEEDSKKRRLPDFEITRLQIRPSDPTVIPLYVKPGHWVNTQQRMRANNFDFSGENFAASTDESGQPLLVDSTLFSVEYLRPNVLPKGQSKVVEALYHVPWTPDSTRRVWLQHQLRQGGREMIGGTTPTARMEGYQFFFLVLAANPDEYSYVKLLDTVQPPLMEELSGQPTRYYHVLAPKVDRLAPVPGHSLAWTTIACVLWDQLDPQTLSAPQQQALLDWLHWGGQLIISGPDTLSTLQRSFLADVLPAEGGEVVDLDESALAPLNEHWSLESRAKRQRMTLNVDGGTIAGTRLQLRDGSQFLPGTGELVAERRCGLGRVVVTSFRLSDRRLKQWGSLDNFVNNGLLRRPAREFSHNELQLPQVKWREGLEVRDPRLLASIQYFTRDVAPLAELTLNTPPKLAEDTRDWHYRGQADWGVAGIAPWNDRSGASDVARKALKEAAGIDVPRAEFVLKSLTIYLLVLVPLNWLLFRLLGRVEWAWAAAPVIALLGAVFVARAANLNIGFARSLTELAVLEVQGDYSRGHLTRYDALYTSLSTSYSVTLDDAALAEPFAAKLDKPRLVHDEVTRAVGRIDRQVSLGGVFTNSNATSMVHVEQMLPLGGVFTLRGEEGKLDVANETVIDLQDAGVIRRRDDGTLEGAYLGTLVAGTQQRLTFRPLAHVWPGPWAGTPLIDGADPSMIPRERQGTTTSLPGPGAVEGDSIEGDAGQDAESGSAKASGPGRVRLGAMARLAAAGLRLARGEVRLIGRTAQPLEGAEFRPVAAQSLHDTLVLVHLRQATLPPPAVDTNLRIDFGDQLPAPLNELDAQGVAPGGAPQGPPIDLATPGGTAPPSTPLSPNEASPSQPGSGGNR